MTNKDQAIDHLVSVAGDNPDKIADLLSGDSILGIRLDDEECPLARWLRVKTGATDVTVDVDCIYIGGSYYATPGVLYDFICKFDGMDYPSLVEEC